MMQRVLVIWLLTLGGFGLAACGETPQTATGVRTDTQAFQGTGMPFTAAGWKPGDKNSWEQQLKVRTQNGQNDYAKVQ